MDSTESDSETLETTHRVTRVGVDNVQFYIPQELSSHDRFPFEAEDGYRARTLPDAGLLLTPTDGEAEVTLGDLLDALEVSLDDDLDPHNITL